MDAERARSFLLSLPHVVETRQWGDNLVFWVGDKTIGGKMFCLVPLSPAGLDAAAHVMMYSAGPEHYPELLERDGFRPAPYMARIFWVAVERWSALRHAEWEEDLRAAHAITLSKLPRRTREILTMPRSQQTALIAERQRLLAARQASGSSRPSAAKKRRAPRKGSGNA